MSSGETLRSLCMDLAAALREELVGELGAHRGRAHVGEHEGRGGGGDVTFAIDERAERLMEEFLAEHAPEVAFYSEDRGMVSPAGADPSWVLVVDPIDGTRPALAGFESACVSVAAAPLGAEPVMGDVEVGCIVEIKSGGGFVAVRGAGLRPAPSLSRNEDPARMFWSFGLRGRPARETVEVLAELIDASSVGGASFELGSATYDMTRIATGQLDAYVEPGPRIVREVSGMRQRFEQVGGGSVLNNSPYDLAAAVLCLREAGATVTDANGHSLDDRPLLGSGP
ncbi:MAG TPA: inositol monophosphatase family protein, partial [Solirubrobacterales bacterium]|nr:inositol monophosphatase family protein [Solirubrobacterales bacterium]